MEGDVPVPCELGNFEHELEKHRRRGDTAELTRCGGHSIVRIIALMNQKGGVGKTTTTVNLGAALAELGQNVCLIDLDPQAHLTINYGVDPSPEITSLYNVLVEERPLVDAMHSVGERITLVPSSIDLAAAEIELVSVLGRETLLRKRIEAANPQFDFILLDCPPSLGLLTINALAVADEVLVPMQAHFLALQGVAKLLETVQLVNRRMNPHLRVGGIILTMFDSQTRLTGEVVDELLRFIEQAQGKNLPWSRAKLFQSRIRRNIKLAESPSFGQTILKYEPSSNGAADYRALARELLGLPAVAAGAATEPAEVRESPGVESAKPSKAPRRKARAMLVPKGTAPTSIVRPPGDPAPGPPAGDEISRADASSPKPRVDPEATP